MKILEINGFRQFSVGRIIDAIAREAEARGHEARIAYARNYSASTDSIKIGGPFSYYWHALMSRFFDSDGLHSRRATKELLSEIDRWKPDIIHIHCLHSYFLNYPLFFEFVKIKGIPVVWTHHDCWAFTGHCAFFDAANCTKWKTRCSKCPLKSEYPKSFFLDRSKANYIEKKKVFKSAAVNKLFMVTPSRYLENLLKASFLSDYETKIIRNGINLADFNRSSTPEITSTFFKLPEKFVLAVASVWDERKGLGTVLELANALPSDWHIVVVGRIKKRYKLPKRIIHVDRTENREELKALYQKCDLFFNPTLGENYPTVNLEAQACGAKVLTFNTGGSEETQAGNLYVINKESSIDELVNALLGVAKKTINPIDYSKLDDRTMGREYMDYLEEIVGRGKH